MNDGLEKHIPLWLKIGMKELKIHEKYKMSYDQLRNYYIERIIGINKIIPTIDLLNQDGKWYGRRDLNDTGFDGFDFSYFMTTYLISHNVDIESLLDNPQQLNQLESNLVQNTINYYNSLFNVIDIKNDFNEINTPQELMDYMNKNISYGYLDNNGCKHYDSLNEIREKYKTKSENVILHSNIGNCIDQAKLQKKFFDNKGYKNKLYCIIFSGQYCPEKIKIHPITLYKENGRWYHFEHAFYNYRGIHESDIAVKLVDEFITKCFNYSFDIEINEIDSIPEDLTIDQFIKYVKNCRPMNKVKK